MATKRFSYSNILLHTSTAGPDPEMLLPGGGGGTDSRSLEPSSESHEGEEEERGAKPPSY